MTTTSGRRAAALTMTALTLTAAGLASAPAAEAATTTSGTLRPGASVTYRTPGTVKFCVTNRGPGATATVVVRGRLTERIRVTSRICTSVSTFGRLTLTNVSGGTRPSFVGYTVYGAGVQPL